MDTENTSPVADHNEGLSIQEAASQFASMFETLDEGTTEEEVAEETETVSTPSDAEAVEAEGETPTENPEAEVADAEDAEPQAEEAPVYATAQEIAEIKDDAEVIFNGRKVKVSDLPGFMKHADYKEKTQELAAAKRAATENQANLRGEALKALEELRHKVLITLETPPDFEKLATEDAELWVQEKQKWEKKAAAIAELDFQYKSLKAQQVEHEKKVHQEARAACEAEVLRTIPEFANPTTGKATTQAFGKWMMEKGIPKENIAQETNPVLFQMGWELYKHEMAAKSTAQAVAKVDSKPALTKPGVTTSKPVQSEYDKAKARAKASGKPEHVAAAWSHLL